MDVKLNLPNLPIARDVLRLFLAWSRRAALSTFHREPGVEQRKENINLGRMRSELNTVHDKGRTQWSCLFDLVHHIRVVIAENSAFSLASAANKAVLDYAFPLCTSAVGELDKLADVVPDFQAELPGGVTSMVQLFANFAR